MSIELLAKFIGPAVRCSWLAASALVLCACPKAAPPSRFPTGQDALERMKASYACANGVQGEGKLDHFSDQGRVRGEIYSFAVNPARLRFDVVSPFGTMLYTLTSNGRDFHMLDLKENAFLYGPASACNLARLTQVPLPGHVLVSVLRGEVPLLTHRAQDVQIEWDSGHYIVDIPSTRDAHQRIALEVYDDDYDKTWQKQRVRAVEVSVKQRGRVLYDVEMSRHEAAARAPARVDPDGLDPDLPPSGGTCSAEIPRSIRMRVPSTGDDVIFQYKKVAFNPPLPTHTFFQSAPAGARALHVTCQ